MKLNIILIVVSMHTKEHDIAWSETTLNYWMMVERYLNLKEEVGGPIPGCEISSMLDGKLARW